MCFQTPAKPHKGLVKSPETGVVFTHCQMYHVTKVHPFFMPMMRRSPRYETGSYRTCPGRFTVQPH